MKVLITGVAGFIGSHLADHLLAQGHEVTGIDDLSTGREGNVPSGVEFVIDDIANIARLHTDADVIYHCAASYKDRDAWEQDARTNVLGTIAVVREALRVDAKLVYFQTSLCYGPHPGSPVSPKAPLDPHGSYAVSKTAGEAYIRDSGVRYVSLRLANMYGPRNLTGPVPTFYMRLAEGKPCTVVDTRRDFVYVADLIEVALRAATQGSGVYHVASGVDIPIRTLYGMVADAMGVDAPAPLILPRGADDVATLLLDPLETESAFGGWTVGTSLTSGIAAAVGWYDAVGVTETYTHLAMKG